MRLAHLSDLHFYAFPNWRGIFSKRLLGLANLYLRGRIRQFAAPIACRAIAAVIADQPDGVVISGDLTALASPQEFIMAREALEPLIRLFPTVVVPGNHDYYTRKAIRCQRIEAYFGDVIRTPAADLEAPIYPTLHRIGETVILGMNPNRFSLAAAGRIDPEEVLRLGELLRQPAQANAFKILVLHYPLFNRGGRVTNQFWRRLENRHLLLELLSTHPVDLVLHGHDHQRYSNLLPPATYLANPGAAGSVHASYNLYRIESGRLLEITHKDYRDGDFTITYQGPPQ